MALKLIGPPEIEPITLEQAIRHLNEYMYLEPGYTLQEYIADLIVTARETCEEYQNRAYLTQKWELWLDSWPSVLEIPRPPLQEVESVEYYDRDNEKHNVDEADYFVDCSSEPGRVIPLVPWPADLRPASGICITFAAGHDEVAKVPRRVRQAILH